MHTTELPCLATWAGNNLEFCLLKTIYKVLFVCVEALRPSQQFFSHVGTEPPLPG